MKKSIAIILTIVLVFAVCACGKEKTNDDGSNIEISIEGSYIRYLGYEFVPDNFGLMGSKAEKTIYLKFEYTNKTETPKNVKEDFSITALQNNQVLDIVKGWNAEVDATAYTNYLNGLVKNETLPVYYAVKMNDYSPVTVCVSTLYEEDNISKSLIQEITPPEDVIVPNELTIEIDKLYCSWIDLHNGDILTIKEGKSDGSIVKGSGSIEYMGVLNGTTGRNFSYSLEGDVLKIGNERFVVSLEKNKIFLRSKDTETVYERLDDFYLFEDIKVHKIGDTVSTDVLKFTLNDHAYADYVSGTAIGAMLYGKPDELVPDNGQIWKRLSYNVTNIGRDAFRMNDYTTLRFTVVYDNSYAFAMDTYNWITKGYGGEEDVTWMGAGYGNHTLVLPALSSVDYDTWVPVAPLVREDTKSSIYLLVLAKNSMGYEMFAYELQ